MANAVQRYRLDGGSVRGIAVIWEKGSPARRLFRGRRGRPTRLTVNPYLGSDGVSPFIKVAAREHKGIFVLVRTFRNSVLPGEFQDLAIDGKPLYRHVADRLQHNGPSLIAEKWVIVSSAQSSARLHPEQRWPNSQGSGVFPASFYFVPGYGIQGASASEVAGAFDNEGLGRTRQ